MSEEKPLFTISIASKLLGLHPRTLMLYEKAGLILPHRTTSNRRLFSLKDLKRLQFIKYLTKKQRLNLAGVKVILEAVKIAKEKGLRLKRRLFPSFKLQKLI